MQDTPGTITSSATMRAGVRSASAFGNAGVRRGGASKPDASGDGQRPQAHGRRESRSRWLAAAIQRVLPGAAALLLAACVHLPHPEIAVAPAQSPGMVVFDIDGTLTPRVPTIFSVRPDAANVVQLYADRGHHIVYLTARMPQLHGALRGYLRRNGFPAGDLVAPPSRAEHVAPAPFKARVLEGYRAKGWDIIAAYGDSSTDFVAYADADVPRERVFALRRVGAAACKPGVWAACLSGWSTHLQALAADSSRSTTGTDGDAGVGASAGD